MNLVVDSGNSAAKVAIFDQSKLSEKFTFAREADLQLFLNTTKAENLIVSSVNADAQKICDWAVNAKRKFVLTYKLPLPITIRYSTPHTLGVDRIAGACGAVQLFPGSNSLVIDAGSCITYDFTDEKGNYHGGGISPGLMMRFKA